MSHRRAILCAEVDVLKVNEDWIRQAEEMYPGFRATLNHYETVALPPCPACGSTNTATVGVGVIGRTIALAAATTKLKLVPRAQAGDAYCNACDHYFEKDSSLVASSRFIRAARH